MPFQNCAAIFFANQTNVQVEFFEQVNFDENEKSVLSDAKIINKGMSKIREKKLSYIINLVRLSE